MAAVVAVVSIRPWVDMPMSRVLFGCGMAIASAATVATSITMVDRAYKQLEPVMSVAWQPAATRVFTNQ